MTKSIPLIKRSSFPPLPASCCDLPFIVRVEASPGDIDLCWWRVAPTDDYARACHLGMQYACDLIQFFKDNPSWIDHGILRDIAADMAKPQRGDATHGYAVGFWSFVETMLQVATASVDHWAMAEAHAKWRASLDAKSKSKSKAKSKAKSRR